MFYPENEMNPIKIYDDQKNEIIVGFYDKLNNIHFFPAEAKSPIVYTDKNLFILRFARFIYYDGTFNYYVLTDFNNHIKIYTDDTYTLRSYPCTNEPKYIAVPFFGINPLIKIFIKLLFHTRRSRSLLQVKLYKAVISPNM